MLITWIIAHIFHYKLNAFFFLGLNHGSFKKINPTAGFLASYLWPALVDYLDGLYPFKIQIG